MNYSEKYGNSIDEAVGLALKDLKVDKDAVTVTVLEEPSKGFLGLGSKLAKVRVQLKEEEPVLDPATEQKVETAETVKEETKEASDIDDDNKSFEKAFGNDKSVKRNRKRKGNRQKKENPAVKAMVRPDDLQPLKEHKAITFLEDTTKKMGLELTFKAEGNEDTIFVDIFGKDSGTIIGKRGQTLDAMQYLTSLVVNKENEKYIRVVLDAENYRSKRKRTLENLADRLAGKVARTGRVVKLEPMNPYERMIIHAALQGDERVVTRSEGEEPYRRVIIELK